MKKKAFVLVLAAAMAATSMSWTAMAEDAGEELTVAGIVFQDDEFMNALINGMQQACDENGVNFVSSNSNNDQSREVELINTYAG